ncbi:hypothetical protein [uncultured Granulicatella sp.]|uniref:hypothetical protein n=1 Tax=uncultured Granulicatella sp. TaxID=316089 RepID=UPI0028F02769|nr:hypothetical protein [uncultured Granulicatella sp.]
MNKVSKIYSSIAMVTSILMFLFGMYFSTKGIVVVTYESWRAMGVSLLAFLCAMVSMMKLPLKIKKGILVFELLLIAVLFVPMMIKGTILTFQLAPFYVIADLTIVYTVVGVMILWMNNRSKQKDNQFKLDSIFINFQILMIINVFFDIFSFGVEVMDYASALQIGQVLRSVFLGTMNLQMLWIAFGILILIGSLLKMVYDSFMLKRESIMSVSK